MADMTMIWNAILTMAIGGFFGGYVPRLLLLVK